MVIGCEVEMDVTTLMRQAACLNSRYRALIAEDRSFTFEEAWGRGIRVANGLRRLGVEPGDRVAGLEDNNLGCADLFLGCAIAGAVRVPLYPRNARLAHLSMLAGTGCRVVVADEVHAQDVIGLDGELDCLRHVLVRDDGYEGWLSGQDGTDPMIPNRDDDWFIIRHSGGTTGEPKGVGYTHHDWVLNCRNWAGALERMRRDSVVAHAGPISHGSGYLFLPAWLAGATNLLMGTFEPGRALAIMRDNHVSHMFASPSLLAALAGHPAAQEYDWPDLRSILVGGAPITDSTALLAREVFGDALFQGFGQTEAVPLAMMGPEEWFADIEGSIPLRAAGRVVPYAQVEVRGSTGSVLPIGQEGEIVVKVEGQMRGYWGDEEMTAARLVDGWVHTQDIGRLDANGFLYVLDRADDRIVSGGFTIWPAELETVIADHPAVTEAAVFAIPDDRWGETPMAVVCVNGTSAVTAEEVIEICRKRLGSYKKPSRVEFTTDPLPKSLVGKVLRKQLREPHWIGRERRVSGA
jgi:acyl-CoA synthetase (AMP-forming)/AMP-acid ligase II